MKSNLIGIGIIVICTILTTIAQYSFKIGSPSLEFSITSFIFNPHIIIGFISYGIASILFIVALRFGELSLLYPFWALSFVWITLISMVSLNENVAIINWTGIGFIVAGISLLGFGAKNG